MVFLVPSHPRSSTYVGLNTLVNSVEPHQQARVNAFYRAVGAGVAIGAPVLATALAAWLDYAPTLVVFAIILGAGSAAAYFHPAAAVAPVLPAPADGVADAVTWRSVVLQPGLLSWFALEELFALGVAPIWAFQAIRLARDFGLPDAAVGAVLSVGAGAAFVGTLLAGPRVPFDLRVPHFRFQSLSIQFAIA